MVLDALPKNKLNRYYSIKGLQKVRTAQGKMGQNSKLRLLKVKVSRRHGTPRVIDLGKTSIDRNQMILAMFT